MTLLYIVIGYTICIFALGFGLGWYVRSGVKKKVKVVTSIHHEIRPGESVSVMEME